MIRIEDVSLAAGTKDLLVGASLHLHPGERVGLVGRNGAGKSTLLAGLLGHREFDRGSVHRRKGIRLGHLPQQAVTGSDRSVWEEARSGMVRLLELEASIALAIQAIAAQEPGAIERKADLDAQFQLAGGYQWDKSIGTVLHGLGFGPDRWRTRCDELSGGWQMRVALARLLLSAPDVALLDEPTNHLDLEARGWLADYLRDAPFTVVVVSHDRHLLDRVSTRIVEVRNLRLHSWAGNFTSFLAAREAARADQEALKAKQDDKIAHLQKYVDRFGAKATKAKQAKSRARQIDKIDRIEIEAPPPLPRIQLPEPPVAGERLLRLLDLSAGWEEPLVSGLDLEVRREMRIAVLGENGSGKSTLLKTIHGRLAPLSGRVLPNERLRMGVFHQDLAAELPPDMLPIEWVAQAAPTLPTSKIRAMLGALGLSGEAALRPIGLLSGGEAARVALAGLTAKPYNLLLLDEPTNHLDAETVEVLVRALRAWTGALLLVSHDRYVVEQLATHVLRVGDAPELKEGIGPEDFQRDRVSDGSAAPAEASTAKLQHAERKKLQREHERATRRLESLPSLLETAEGDVAEVDERLLALSGDWEAAAALGDERQGKQAVVDDLYAEWETLEERIEELAGMLE